MRVRSVRGRRRLELNEMYVGRECGGWKGSVLGNQFVIGRDGTREEVIAKFRMWLWEAIQRRDDKVMAELERLKSAETLSCWCADLDEKATYEGSLVCHAQVIARAIKWLKAQA